MEKIKIGKIVNAVGLKGEVKVYNYSDSEEVYERTPEIYAGDRLLKVQNVRMQKNMVILKLSGIDDRNAAEAHKARRAAAKTVKADREDVPAESALVNWPVQIKLAPIQAPYFEDADLLIAADCSAYAYGNFHGDFIDGKITLMGCPKLDMVDYSEKLTELFTRNTIRSITLTRMEVPCCGGLEYAVKQAVAASGKDIPLKVVTIGINGDLK